MYANSEYITDIVREVQSRCVKAVLDFLFDFVKVLGEDGLDVQPMKD